MGACASLLISVSELKVSFCGSHFIEMNECFIVISFLTVLYD